MTTVTDGIKWTATGLVEKFDEDQTAAAIERTGLAVVPDTPICLPRADAGDAEDHVAPERKAQYSDLYLHRLQSMLSGASSIASDSSN